MNRAASQLGVADSPPPDRTQTLKRRGLLAAGAAFVAGLVAKFSETPVSAGTDGDVVLGAVSASTAQTTVRNNAPAGNTTIGALAAIRSVNLLNVQVGAGLYGFSDLPGNFGVLGESEGADGIGVLGNGASVGVGGFAPGPSAMAVRGRSIAGIGVYGEITSDSMTNTIGIYGLNNSTYAGPGPGAGGFGVYGLSTKGHGLVGATATAGGAAVVGATNGVAGAYAGAFYGPVIVGGALTVVGGPKSAAVSHPDGSHRRLYCMESPESWFEDFGEAQLDCGQTEITIDPDFAALVNLDRYQVFLTEYDQRSDLYVTNRTPVGFYVHGRDADLRARFGWRIVARRKDIAGARLEPVTIPQVPTMPPVPDIRPIETLPRRQG
ncbi:MAG TPA: hypothetical protein VH458_24295 [Vicinamibacterales bacterium]|jgi:hypothetical protein